MRWPWGKRCSFEALLLSTPSCAQRESSLKVHDAIWLISVKLRRSSRTLWWVSGWKLLLVRVIQSRNEEEKLSPLLSCSFTSPSSLHIISSGSGEHLHSVWCLLAVDFDLWPPHWRWLGILIVKELKINTHFWKREFHNIKMLLHPHLSVHMCHRNFHTVSSNTSCWCKILCRH